MRFSSGTLITFAVGLIAAGIVFSREPWAGYLFVASPIALIVALLLRPRERRARIAAEYASFGRDWGEGIGPGPDQSGAIAQLSQLGPSLSRRYTGRNEFEIRTKQRADDEALRARGYLPATEVYNEGKWNGGQWVLAFILLLFLLIPGLAALVYMARVKPGGTADVLYQRQSGPLENAAPT